VVFSLRSAIAAVIALTLFCSSAQAQVTISWDGGTSGGGTAWITATNWAGDTIPSSIDTARFDSVGTSTTIGINMNGATNNGTNNQAVGAISVTSGRSSVLNIWNSSSTAAGTLTLNGATINSQANTILSNFGASTAVLTIQAIQGSNQPMSLAVGNTSNFIQVPAGNRITISPGVSQVSAGSSISLIGGGTLELRGVSTYTGSTAIQNGTLIAHFGDDRLPTGTAVTLGSATNSGVLQIGDSTVARSQTIAGLTTSGSGTSNAVVGAHATNDSTLTVNNSTAFTYSGRLGGDGTNQN
jgi:autotransporter-associated beta strand protein